MKLARARNFFDELPNMKIGEAKCLTLAKHLINTKKMLVRPKAFDDRD